MNVLKMENNKKFIRSNKAQIAYLCQFMAGHPAFAAGDYRTPLGASSCNSQWEKLKRELDELGPQRSVEQWKIAANALRKQANVLREAANVQRAEANALRREAAITAQRHLSYLIAKDKKEEESARLRCPPSSNSEHN
ncbi:uncharacterized protein [Maniola hyperantus]|uniref:uncharacterized protein isoform X3 n=1 Tax=Aphantopus hyperantus TaxID=2795564 RepID=UPI00374982EC